MDVRNKYRKKANQVVVAIQIDLETEGLTYQKWGDTQHAKPGDWLLNNNGEVYTVDQATFAQTYRSVGTGHYVKESAVWARIAQTAGSVATKEGNTHYRAGDFLVSNNEDGTDSYAMTAASFLAMYELEAEK